MSEPDWVQWHESYDDPDSNLSRRLLAVQARIRDALDEAPPGRVNVVSMCAGEGRDLLGVIADHPRGSDVHARLVELNPVLANRARNASTGRAVEVIEKDAAQTDSYAGAVPARIVLVCGVFGNISDAEIERTIAALPAFTAHGGHVIWTRHRREPDLTPRIRAWFAAHGFQEVWFSCDDPGFGAGAHRFTGTPQPLPRGRRLFAFGD
jgi:hypothetical protein